MGTGGGGGVERWGRLWGRLCLPRNSRGGRLPKSWRKKQERKIKKWNEKSNKVAKSSIDIKYQTPMSFRGGNRP